MRYHPVMTWGSVSSVFVRRVLAGAIARGADPVALTSAVGLDPLELRNVDARVPHEVMLALWTEAARLTGDPCFGVHLAEMVGSSPNNVLGYAAHSSPTYGAALRRVARYIRLLHDSFEVLLSDDGELAEVELRQLHPAGAHRQGLEFGLAISAFFARRNLEQPLVLRAVSLAHQERTVQPELERVFSAPVTLGAGKNAIRFDRAYLDAPFSVPDPQLCSQLDRRLDELIARQLGSSNLHEKARGAISESLREGSPTIEQVAARLRMSPRTLQRRLRDSKSSFQELVLEVRRDLALRYLKEADLSVAEVAFHVGFSDVAAFHHAFKRWTGQTPVQARRAG
jgi:AraC-like DNA-binding protein